MINNEYNIVEILSENNIIVVKRAIRISDAKKVVLKILKSSVIDASNTKQFENEQRILHLLDAKQIVKLVKSTATASESIHVFEDVGGLSLDKLISQKYKFTLNEILHISLELAYALKYIHTQNIIHADLNPKNIVYNTKNKELQIIDFGLSIIKDEQQYDPSLQNLTAGNLFFIPPEQTGLTNQVLDYRSDIYSFGMTLYYLLLDQNQMLTNDKFALLHKQMAFNIEPLSIIKQDIPNTLSLIVETLTKKRKDQRYQTVDAITYDIQKCIENLDKSGNIKFFEIRTKDLNIIKIGSQIFGRDAEISLLKNAAQNIVDLKFRDIIVSGCTGVGKTRLIEEFTSYINRNEIYFIKGKFEQYKRFIPYVGFSQVFKDLVTQLVAQVDFSYLDTINKSYRYILKEIFPEFKTLFLLEKDTSSNFIADRKSLLALALKEFLNVVVKHSKPIIIFLDDLQWMDNASVNLLEEIFFNNKNPNIHLLGSFRDKEILENPLANQLLRKMKQKNHKYLLDLELKSLDKSVMFEMFSKTIKMDKNKVESFTRSIYKKTLGNPFYIKTYIEHLIDLNELYFQNGEWKYFFNKIQTHSSSLDIAELVNEKFDTLELKEKEYLQYLAILGSNFNIKITYDIMNSLGFKNTLLVSLGKEGFIDVSLNHYSFEHDLIQQYVFSHISDAMKLKIHYDIGTYFYKSLKNKDFSNAIIVVNHLNRAYKEGELPKEFFKLNVEALEYLLQCNSYEEALVKSTWIKEKLHNKDIFKPKELFRFSLLYAKSLYLNTRLEEAYEAMIALIQKTQTTQDRLQCFSLLKNICITQGENFNVLIEYGKKLFNELHINISFKNDALKVINEKLDFKISNNKLLKHEKDIITLPHLQSTKKRTIMALLVDFWETAYYVADLDLMKWSYLNIVDLSLKFGNTSESTFGYVLYGSQLISQKKYHTAKIFANVALKLNKKFQDDLMLPKVHNFVANFINPYTKNMNTNIKLYQKSLVQSKINGDIIFGIWASFLMHFSNFLHGEKLHKLQSLINEEKNFILDSGDAKIIAIFNFLRDSLNDFENLKIANCQNEKETVALFEKENFYPGLTWYAIIKAQKYLLFSDYENGLSILSKYVKLEDNEVIMFPKIRLHFIRTLLLLGVQRPLDDSEKSILKKDLKELDILYTASPKNFKFQRMLLSLQRKKKIKTPWSLAKSYEMLVQEAYKQENSFYIVLAYLHASKYWGENANEDMSNLYKKKLIVSLEQWGACKIANHYKDLKQKTNMDTQIIYNLSSNFNSLSVSFEAIAISKSKEELVTTLLKIIAQNAIASKVVLLIKQGKEFYVKAASNFQNSKVELYDKLMSDSDIIPKNILNYTINKSKYSLIENPSISGEFEFDPYIQKHKPALCLSIPSVIEGKVEAVLYIENTDIVTTIHNETLHTLELLFSQAIVTFKNIIQLNEINTKAKEVEILKEQLEHAITGTNAGLWDWNLETNKVYYAPPWKDMLGYEDDEIKNDLDEWKNRVHPSDLKQALKDIKRSHENEDESYENIHRLRHKDGHWVWILDRGKTLFNTQGKAIRMIGFHTDITTQKNLENEVRISLYEKNERVKEIQCLYNISQTIQEENDTKNILKKVLQYIPLGWQFPKKTSARVIFDAKTYLSEGFQLSEHKQSADIFINEIQRGVIEVFVDASSINSLREFFLKDEISLLKNIANSISIAIKNLESSEALKSQEELIIAQSRHVAMGEMIGMIAHQWRQPITVISMGANNMLIDMELEEVKLENFKQESESILQQTEYLSQTIEDFRNFFKPDKQRELVKVSDVLKNSLTLIESAFYNNTIEVNISSIDDAKIKTFSRELLQVFINILKNSKEALVEFRKENRKIDIDISETSKYIKTVISDNAWGIDVLTLPKIFNPYFTTKSNTVGTGLGLYMSKTIVEKHLDGRISAENKNDGASFEILIPKNTEEEINNA